MTRKRRRRPAISQMPQDPMRRMQVEALDAAIKTRQSPEVMSKIAQARTERIERHRAERAVADIISQGRKQPKIYDEINSARAGGHDT